MACAASRATSGERRASPNFLASASSSSLTSFFSLALLSRMAGSFALLGQLVLLAADLHFLQARQLLQLGFEDVVGLFSDRPKRAISAGFGSSSVRMMRITSSRLRKAPASLPAGAGGARPSAGGAAGGG
jgi:hypothetical protein